MSTTEILDEKPVPDVQAPFKGPTWGGWSIPDGVTLAYGARAIYSLREIKRKRGRGWSMEWHIGIDLLWDRQDMVGGTDAERKAFVTWLNKTAIPALRNKCLNDFVQPSEDAVITFASDGYAITAGPRASYGYMYITAWKVVDRG